MIAVPETYEGICIIQIIQDTGQYINLLYSFGVDYITLCGRVIKQYRDLVIFQRLSILEFR